MQVGFQFPYTGSTLQWSSVSVMSCLAADSSRVSLFFSSKLGALQDLEGGKRMGEDLQNTIPPELAASSQVRAFWGFVTLHKGHLIPRFRP